MSATSGWAALRQELDAWRATGRQATLWWRDDDAGPLTPALERLLGLAETSRTPLAVAAVPAWLTAEAAARIRGCPGAVVLQHGFAHENHEPEDRKKSEFGPSRGHGQALAALRAGRAALAACGASPLPVLAPPWNAVAPRLVPRLAAAGFTGLSTFRPRAAPMPAPGVVQTNTHCDIVDWRGSRGFVGEDAALEAVVSHLRGRRLGDLDSAEPTGLLTHHAVHDEACWRFLERFLATAHPAAFWPPVRTLFDPAGAA